MNKYLLYILLILPIFGFSQKDTIAHLYTFGSVANDVGEDIAATDDGGFVIIGSTASSGDGNTDIYLLKVDSLCNYQWSWALGGTNNDWGYAIKQTYDKGFIIAASTNSYSNGGYDAMLLKRDSLGNYEWQKTYGGNDWDFAYDVVQTFDSGFVFCGETYNNTAGFSDVYVVKTNSVGDTLWTRTVGGSLTDKGNALIQTSDSNIVVSGIKNTQTDSTQAYVLKFDKDGVLLWDSIYGGAGYESLADVIELQSGKYAFTGTSNSLNSNFDLDHYYLKLDTNGILLNFNTFVTSGANSNDDESNSILQLQNGRLLIIGYTKSFGFAKKDVVVNAINDNGNWAGIGITFGYTEDDEINGSVITNNGRLLLIGKTKSYGIGNDDLFVIRLDTVYQTNYFNQNIYYQYEDIAPISVRKLTLTNTELNVYPNPATTQLTIKTKVYPLSLSIYDNLGRQIFSTVIDQENFKLNIDFLLMGLYTMSFSNQTSFYETKRIVITK
ncbi:MAG: T9SS type A sorting domain-containing protein [Bacteroidetes bacterium]|nr:T9SS type A sorting domain-containing protein [Bacteroidota bacterium]